MQRLFKLTVLTVFVMVVIFCTVHSQPESMVEFEEGFNSDVIGSGEWVVSDGSVYVDEPNGWLRIGADGAWDDYAERHVSLSLPVTIETRMRLVSGGRNYTLPGLGLYFGPTGEQAGYITYLPNIGDGQLWGWKFMDEWTNIHVLGPVAENQWLTVKAIIDSDGGELYAKRDDDASFTLVTTGSWSIPSIVTKIRVTQPWDAVSDFDYIKWSGGSGPVGWCDDFEGYAPGASVGSAWYLSGNISSIADPNVAFSGSQSLKMYGINGACWGAVADRLVDMPLPLEISFAVRNGTEPLSGCHPYRASFGLRTGGPHWSNCPCPQLVVFKSNGNLWLPRVTDGVSEFSGYGLEEWIKVDCRLTLPGDGLLHAEIWANSEFLQEFTMPEEAWMHDAFYLDIAAQEGTVWFDDVCVKAPSPVANLAVDIKPGSCPNPLNVKPGKWVEEDIGVPDVDAVESGRTGKRQPWRHRSRGVLPVAICGTGDFDVTMIDPSTVTLEGVPLERWSFDDVSTPLPDGAGECECPPPGVDGFVDLNMKFDRVDVIEALGEVSDGEIISLTVTGMLNDGTPFEGSDCVVIIHDSYAEVEDPTLIGNYPNPFNPSTQIEFYLPEASDVALDVFNVLGRKVTTLADGFYDAGVHTVEWNAEAAASGVYFYRLQAGDFVDRKKMILLK